MFGTHSWKTCRNNMVHIFVYQRMVQVQQRLKTTSHDNIYRYIILLPQKTYANKLEQFLISSTKQLPTKNQPTSTNQPQLLTAADRRLERVERRGWHASVSPAQCVTLWQSPLENVAPERGEFKRTVSSKSRLRFPEMVLGGNVSQKN